MDTMTAITAALAVSNTATLAALAVTATLARRRAAHASAEAEGRYLADMAANTAKARRADAETLAADTAATLAAERTAAADMAEIMAATAGALGIVRQPDAAGRVWWHAPSGHRFNTAAAAVAATLALRAAEAVKASR